MTGAISKQCHHVIEQREHVIIGISPFNSYFSESVIRGLAAWGLEHFSKVSFYLPDLPSQYTLVALGYLPHKAQIKARRQANYIRNRIAYATSQYDQGTFSLFDHEYLKLNELYQYWLTKIRFYFDTDIDFRTNVLELSKVVLMQKKTDLSIPAFNIDKAALIGAEYILAELPIMLRGADIVSNQTPTVFCYHECPKFLFDYFFHRNTVLVSSQQAFLVLPQNEFESVFIAARQLLKQGE